MDTIKIRCDAGKLAAAATLAFEAVNRRAKRAALLNLLFVADAEHNRVTVTGTDLATVVSVALEAEVNGSGGLLLPGETFRDLACIAPEGELRIKLNLNDCQARIDARRMTSHLNGMSSKDFPTIPRVGDGPVAVVESAALAGVLDLTTWAVAPVKDDRPILQGAYLQLRDDGLSFSASDGYRLSHYALTPQDFASTAPLDAIIPIKGCRLLRKMLRHTDTVGIAPLQAEGFGYRVAHRGEEIETVPMVAFVLGDAQLFCRTTPGKYPDVHQIIPTGWTTRALLQATILLPALKAAIAVEDASVLDLSFYGGDNNRSLALSLQQHSGEYNFATPVEMLGADLEISASPKFLLQLFKAAKGRELAVELTSKNNPLKFTWEDAERGASFVHLIMPMHHDRK